MNEKKPGRLRINCFDSAAMEDLLRSLRPCGVSFTRRGFWHVWRPDFTATAPDDFMPRLRELVDVALAWDDIERRAW